MHTATPNVRRACAAYTPRREGGTLQGGAPNEPLPPSLTPPHSNQKRPPTPKGAPGGAPGGVQRRFWDYRSLSVWARGQGPLGGTPPRLRATSPRNDYGAPIGTWGPHWNVGPPLERGAPRKVPGLLFIWLFIIAVSRGRKGPKGGLQRPLLFVSYSSR